MRLEFRGMERMPIWVETDEIAAIQPSEFSPERNTYIVLKCGHKIAVSGETYEIEAHIKKHEALSNEVVKY